jgi:hypothetical protein
VDGHSIDQPDQTDPPAGLDAAAPGDEPTGDGRTDVERRRSPRIAANLDAQYRRLGRDTTTAEVATVDVSHGGVRITASTQMAVGDVLQLVVEMPQGIELTLQGLVVQLTSSDNQHHAHVAFDSLSTAAADLLTELLDERAERAERAEHEAAADLAT